MENNYIVYKHIFPNNKVYIGITRRKPEIRWNNGKGYKSCPLMNKAIQKYGWENVKHEILFTNLSKKQAEKQTGVLSQNIGEVCRGQQKYAKGYLWRYANDN